MVHTSFSTITALVFLALGTLSSIDAAAIPTTPQSSLATSHIAPSPTVLSLSLSLLDSVSDLEDGAHKSPPPPTDSNIHRRRLNPLKVAEDAGKGFKDIDKGVEDIGDFFDQSSGNSTTRRDILFFEDTSDDSESKSESESDSDHDVHRRVSFSGVAKGAEKGYKDGKKLIKANKQRKKLKKAKEAADKLNESSGNSTRRDISV